MVAGSVPRSATRLGEVALDCNWISSTKSPVRSTPVYASLAYASREQSPLHELLKHESQAKAMQPLA